MTEEESMNVGRSRKRNRMDNATNRSPYQLAYENCTYTPVESTGRPGTPHRFFMESYQVHIHGPLNNYHHDVVENGPAAAAGGDDENEELQHCPPPLKGPIQSTSPSPSSNSLMASVRVHKHKNGLCVVCLSDENHDQDKKGEDDTVGRKNNIIKSCLGLVDAHGDNLERKKPVDAAAATTHILMEDQDKNCSTIKMQSTPRRVEQESFPLLSSQRSISRLELLIQEAPTSSSGAKRKKQSSMLRRGTKQSLPYHQGIVRPTDILGRLYHQSQGDDGRLAIPCAVWGSVLEVNTRLLRSVEPLQTDPLLTGYLAVILPTGPFPPPPPTSPVSSPLPQS